MSTATFLPLEKAIAQAKPPAFLKLKGDLRRIEEQIALVSHERGVQRELSDTQFSSNLKVRTPEFRQAAASKVEDLDRQIAALTRTAGDVRRQIAEIQPVVVQAMEPLRKTTRLQLTAARDCLYQALIDFNAVSVARQEAGAAATILPTSFPHLEEIIRQLDIRGE
ncbi:hypothetical protein [Bradyrhizobium sp. TM233]|uniref:hypothetical protein n=1 Tax=Bradyrhizobium sp. TM233 TaxID=2599801 RepID=UPI0027D68579|nr:hypothetical protein TM233_58880 [Bradyrhizobium sp. TM233]